ncbi:hypothetical protein ACFC5Z_23705 [Streptomyces sp. NPDC056004]|uniref:hypothetical protein n=1 Tax=Streptomyces sp. NPDC056004 TaxID=3345677 RepID=UPI0035D8F2BA
MADPMSDHEQLLHLVDRVRRGVIIPAELDQLAAGVTEQAARITTLEHVAAGNRQHVALVVPELEKAEAGIERVRAELHALNSEVRGIGPIALAGRRDAVARIRAALDEQPTT